MELRGKKIAVFVDNLYQEMEVWYPYFRFKEAGADCVMVGAEAGKTYTSKLGYPAKADESYDQVNADAFDGVVVPGGYAPDHIRRYPKALQFVRDIERPRQAGGFHLPWPVGALFGRHPARPARHLASARSKTM